MFNLFPRRLSRQQRLELQKVQDLETFLYTIAHEVKLNTALVPEGKRFAKQMEAAGKLITVRKNEYVAAILRQMKIPKAQINIQTGTIVPIYDDPGNNQETKE